MQGHYKRIPLSFDVRQSLNLPAFREMKEKKYVSNRAETVKNEHEPNGKRTNITAHGGSQNRNELGKGIFMSMFFYFIDI